MKDTGDCLRLHLGGWSNTKSAFEKVTNGCITNMTPCFDTAICPSLVNHQWYDIQIVVKGNQVQCYINQELLFDIVDRIKTSPVYSVVSQDTTSGDIIPKIVTHRVPHS